MLRRAVLTLAIAAVLLGVLAAPVMASDHLFNAANAPGATMRGFTNPVGANPSGTSGAMAMPATVPGEGDPKVGGDQTTPAVDLDLVNVRSDGHGTPMAP